MKHILTIYILGVIFTLYFIPCCDIYQEWLISVDPRVGTNGFSLMELFFASILWPAYWSYHIGLLCCNIKVF